MTEAKENNGKVYEYMEFSALYNRKESESEAIKQFRQMESLRENAQESLGRLSKQRPGNVDIQLRLGELFLQRARDLEQFSLELDSFGKTAEAKAQQKKIKPLYSKGLKIQTGLLPRLKNHSMEASVYFGIARTQASLNQKSTALATLQRALKIKNVRPEVLLQIWMLKGDLAFTLSRGGEALQAYSKAAELVTKDSLEDIYVSYRLGWTEYNLKDPNTAIKHMRRVLSDSRNRYQIKDEAVKDYALFASDLSQASFEAEGATPGIYNFLKGATSAEQAFDSIVYMGKIFAKHGHRKKAIDAYEFLLSEQPLNVANAEIALTIVDWSKTLADQHQMKDRFIWLLDGYGPQSKWHSKLDSKPDVQKNSSDAIELALRAHAVKLHKELKKESAQKRKDILYEVVAKLYDAHIKAFSDQPRIYYYRAEIYRDQKSYADSGRSYDKYNLYIEPLEREGSLEDVDKKLSLESAMGAVEVWAKAVEGDKVYAKDFLFSAERFLTKYPKHEIAPQVALDAAKVELQSGNNSMALSRIQYLVDNFPKYPQTVKAVHAALDILNQQNDYMNLAVKARTWLDGITKWAPKAEVPKISSELNSILSKTEAKACEALSEQADRQLEAAICYQRFARGFAENKLASKALLLSSDLFTKWGDHISSLESLRTLVERYPESEQAVGAFSKLATAYEKTFQFEEAANIYEKLLANDSFKDSDKVLERLLMVLQGLNSKSRLDLWLNKKIVSVKLKQEILKKELVEQMMSLRFLERKFGYNKSGLVSKEAADLYKSLSASKAKGDLSLDLDLELVRVEGELARASGNLSKADSIWMAGLKRFWKVGGKTPEIWESAARLRLAQGSYWKHMFDGVTLTNNAQKKLEIYQKLEAWYAEVINMKAPAVALESLWETAKLYDEFSKELLALPQTKTQGEEMARSSKMLLRKIAESASKWRVFSPVLLAALDKLKGKEEKSDISQLEFPWPALPPQVELSQAEASWGQWKDSSESLRSIMAKKGAARSEQKRAAFVSLFRDPSLKDANLSRWADLLNEKNGVQLRIQALIGDGNYRKAELFLSQYDALFGEDSFYRFHIAKNAWSRGNYSVAYKIWSSGLSDKEDFASAYTAAGWAVLLEELVDQEVSKSTSEKVFSNLSASANQLWKKQYLAYLCVTQSIICSDANKTKLLLGSLHLSNPTYLIEGIADRRSVRFVRHSALEAWAQSRIASMTSMKEAPELRQLVNDLRYLTQKTSGTRRAEAFDEYRRLKALLNSNEVRVTRLEDGRKVATSKGSKN